LIKSSSFSRFAPFSQIVALHNKELLKTCFAEISKEDDVELVGQIPTTSQHSYIECWKLSTYISVAPVAEKIELYIGFDEFTALSASDAKEFNSLRKKSLRLVL